MLLPLVSFGLLTTALSSAIAPWQIPSMSIKGPVGPPYGTGPINITFSFDFFDPNTNTNTTCSAAYAPANYPISYTRCLNPNVAFKFEGPYNFGNFTLDIRNTYTNNSLIHFNLTSAYGAVLVTANHPGEPGNYLTCIEYGKFQPETCSINPELGASPPILVPVSSALTFQPFELAPVEVQDIPISSQAVASSINFTVSDPSIQDTTFYSTQCAASIPYPDFIQQWQDCAGDAGFSFRVPEYTNAGNFSLEIKHRYTSQTHLESAGPGPLDNITTVGATRVKSYSVTPDTPSGFFVDGELACGPAPGGAEKCALAKGSNPVLLEVTGVE